MPHPDPLQRSSEDLAARYQELRDRIFDLVTSEVAHTIHDAADLRRRRQQLNELSALSEEASDVLLLLAQDALPV